VTNESRPEKNGFVRGIFYGSSVTAGVISMRWHMSNLIVFKWVDKLEILLVGESTFLQTIPKNLRQDGSLIRELNPPQRKSPYF
jgi:hypothetical protein